MCLAAKNVLKENIAQNQEYLFQMVIVLKGFIVHLGQRLQNLLKIFARRATFAHQEAQIKQNAFQVYTAICTYTYIFM